MLVYQNLPTTTNQISNCYGSVLISVFAAATAGFCGALSIYYALRAAREKDNQ